MNKTISLNPPIIVRKLAEQIGIKPFQLIYDLANTNVFVRVHQTIEPNVEKAICKKFGYTFVATSMSIDKSAEKPDTEIDAEERLRRVAERLRRNSPELRESQVAVLVDHLREMMKFCRDHKS